MAKGYVLLISLFLLLVGCTTSEPSADSKVKTIEPAVSPVAQNTAPENLGTDKILEFAHAGKDYCDKEADSMMKYLCISLYASNKKDEGICYDKITKADFPSNYDSVLSSCIESVAIGKRDVSLCGKVTYNSEHCYSNLAYLKENIAYCQGDNCKASLAFQKSDESICSGISTDYVHDDCITAVAFKKKSPALCSGISDGLRKKICEFAAKGDVSVCRSEQNKLYKDYCFAATVKSVKNPALCGEISSGSQKETSCIKYLAGSLKDYGICESAQDANYREWCIQYAASSSGDTAKCKELSNPTRLTGCRLETWGRKIGGRSTGFSFLDEGEGVGKQS